MHTENTTYYCNILVLCINVPYINPCILRPSVVQAEKHCLKTKVVFKYRDIYA